MDFYKFLQYESQYLHQKINYDVVAYQSYNQLLNKKVVMMGKMFFSANNLHYNFDIFFLVAYHQHDCSPQMQQYNQI